MDHGPWTLDLLKTPRADRLWQIARGFREGLTVEEIHELTQIDPWFLNQIREIVVIEKEVGSMVHGPLSIAQLWQLKEIGFADKRIATLTGTTEEAIRKMRDQHNIRPVYKMVDTCAGEFEAHTPYLYSTYENEEECPPINNKKKVAILGSGPNRIGQGIEFDYACVHAALAFREAGFETIMINCNPETVSTDYDISDRLYFEPLTFEDVMNIIDKEKPNGVVVQFGGQTPLKLSTQLHKAGVTVLGTAAENIDKAEDRKKFKHLVDDLHLKQPANGLANDIPEAKILAAKIGYPLLLRPSYVLGGRAMVVVYEESELDHALQDAFQVSAGHPVLIDHFLKGAVEVDVDALCDGEEVVVAGVMEHIEEAGVHSGDSSCCLPPHTLPRDIVQEIEKQSIALGKALHVKGLMNIQFAVQNEVIYVLEVNPRASRTVPFVSKATGIPWAKLAVQVLAGASVKDLIPQSRKQQLFAVKSPVFPFIKFPGVDTILSPEMCSIGEVMGRGRSFAEGFAKAQIAASQFLPKAPARIFLSVHDGDKAFAVPLARELTRLGFQLISTHGTTAYLANHGIASKAVNKLHEGPPHIMSALSKGKIDLVINTTLLKDQIADSFLIRRTALEKGVPNFTNIHAAQAAVEAMAFLQTHPEIDVLSLNVI